MPVCLSSLLWCLTGKNGSKSLTPICMESYIFGKLYLTGQSIMSRLDFLIKKPLVVSLHKLISTEVFQ